MQLPNDEKQRKILADAIEAIVEVKLDIDARKESIKGVLETLKEDHGIKPAEVRKRVKMRYKQRRSEIEYQYEREQNEALYVENEILFGKEESDE